MATYVLGDVHGCFASLEALLAKIDFSVARDRLWLVGDLVNRGPGSLEVLRWARSLSLTMGERLVALLGNHDLHLLARHAGFGPARGKDTLEAVLAAPDAEQLLGWLAARPLLHREGETLLVHAGLLPSWSPGEAEALARAAEARLRAPGGLAALLAKHPPAEPEPLRAVVAALTRLRTFDAAGRLADHAGPPATAPPGCRPWFEMPARRSAGATVIFGHWAALGLYRAPGLVGLDSGCVWGGPLSALRLEDGRIFEQPALERPPQCTV